MQPILHLSIPVRDLDEALDFYEGALGCARARRREGFADVWFFGMQVTLQERPEEAGTPPGGCRHFGVTLGPRDFQALVARLRGRRVDWVVPVSTDHPGLPTEQTKGKVSDPSGNVIEVKTYRHVTAALEIPPGGPPAGVVRAD